MIFFVSNNGAGPVDLLGEDESYQLVRESKSGKRPSQRGLLENHFIKTVSPANQENKVPGAFIGLCL
jgi:hypothetical protein